jgi:hypothetical protein
VRALNWENRRPGCLQERITSVTILKRINTKALRSKFMLELCAIRLDGRPLKLAVYRREMDYRWIISVPYPKEDRMLRVTFVWYQPRKTNLLSVIQKAA